MDRQYQAERFLLIMDIVRIEKTVRVENLATRLNVSENTVRRDLNILAKRELLQRTKGGAIDIISRLTENHISHRMGKNLDNKETIAEEAFKLIKPGETIILDGGTTSIKLAEKIRGIKHITVLTNSLDIANILSSCSDITLVLSGGILNTDAGTMTGIPAEKFFSEVNADKLFLAVTGLSIDKGLSDQNMYETPVKLKMIEAATEVIVLADSSKFERVAFSPIGALKICKKIITNKSPEKRFVDYLDKIDVELITCTK